jgi:hypothetical protein
VARVDFEGARVDFEEARVDLKLARVDFEEARVDFQYLGSCLDLRFLFLSHMINFLNILKHQICFFSETMSLSKKFAIVIFMDDMSVAVVHTNWLASSPIGICCKHPPTNEATKKLVESGKIDASWNEYNVTVAGMFGEFKLWLK